MPESLPGHHYPAAVRYGPQDTEADDAAPLLWPDDGWGGNAEPDLSVRPGRGPCKRQASYVRLSPEGRALSRAGTSTAKGRAAPDAERWMGKRGSLRGRGERAPEAVALGRATSPMRQTSRSGRWVPGTFVE